MATRTFEQYFDNWRGLDLRDPLLLIGRDYSPELLNIEITRAGNHITKRRGNKIVATKDSAPYLGIFAYLYTDPDTGGVLEEMIGIDEQLKRLTTNFMTVSYAGASVNANLTFTLNSTTNTWQIALDTAGVITTIDVGTGLEAIPTDMTSLAASISGVAGYTATVTGDGTVPAAFLPLSISVDVKSAAQDFTYYTWTTINHTYGATPPFDLYEAAKFDPAFQNATLVNYEDSVFIGTGYEFLHKYDGQTVYRAGLPEASPGSHTLSGGGFTDTNIRYYYRYVQKDNRGRINHGVFSDQIPAYPATISPTAQTVNLTVSNVLAGTGFNTNCAKVNGNQVAVTTIVVDNTNTLQIGDTAYFLDRSSSTYVERLITNRSATSITIDGAAVNVNDDDIISNNLRIEIVRTIAGGLSLFEVVQIPNNSFSATQIYADSTGVTTDEILEPEFPPDPLLLKPRYLAVHQGILVAAGDFDNPNLISLGSIEEPEAFPTATHSAEVRSNLSGSITALASDQEVLLIFKLRAIYMATGDLPSLTFRIEKVHEGQIGCTSQHSIKEIPDKLIFLSQVGFFGIRNGVLDRKLGFPINPAILNRNFAALGLTLNPIRAIALTVPLEEKYFCFIPAESEISSATFPNENSRIFVYDYSEIEDTGAEAGRWLEHHNMNMGGGATLLDEVPFFASRIFNSGLAAIESYLYEQNLTLTDFDYVDHHEPISALYSSAWNSGKTAEGEPSSFKVALRHKIYNQNTNVSMFRIDCRTERDYITGQNHSAWQYLFGTADSSGWGIFPWGIGPWGSPSSTERKVKLNAGKFRSIRFIYTNTYANENMSITGYEYEAAYPYRREMKD